MSNKARWICPACLKAKRSAFCSDCGAAAPDPTIEGDEMLGELRDLRFHLETEFVKTHNAGVTWEKRGVYTDDNGHQVDGPYRAREHYGRAAQLQKRLAAVGWALTQLEAAP